jgi:hypothetical protein
MLGEQYTEKLELMATKKTVNMASTYLYYKKYS